MFVPARRGPRYRLTGRGARDEPASERAEAEGCTRAWRRSAAGTRAPRSRRSLGIREGSRVAVVSAPRGIRRIARRAAPRCAAPHARARSTRRHRLLRDPSRRAARGASRRSRARSSTTAACGWRGRRRRPASPPTSGSTRCSRSGSTPAWSTTRSRPSTPPGRACASCSASPMVDSVPRRVPETRSERRALAGASPGRYLRRREYNWSHVRTVRVGVVAPAPGRALRRRGDHGRAAGARLQRDAAGPGADRPGPPGPAGAGPARRPGAVDGALGPGAVVGREHRHRRQADQRPGRDRHREGRVQARLPAAPVHRARRRVLRVATLQAVVRGAPAPPAVSGPPARR